MIRRSQSLAILFALGLGFFLATAGPVDASKLVTTQGERKIVTVNPRNGATRVILRTNKDIVTALACAGRTDRIVFVTQGKTYVFGGRKRVTERVWVMNGDGSRRKKVRQFSWVTNEAASSALSNRKRSPLDTPIVDIDITDNAQRVLITRNFRMHDFSVAGGPLRFLNRDGIGVFDPEYDPSGRKITAFFDDLEIGIGTINVAAGKPEALRYRVGGREIDYFDGQPTYSPDGSRIAFGSSEVDKHGNVLRGGNAPIWTMRPNGKDPKRIPATVDRNFRIENPVFSPNGKELAITVDTYSEKSGSVGRIMVMGIRGIQLRTAFRDNHYQYQRYLGWLR